MIPKSYVKDSKVSAKGEVTVSGRVRGVYGDKKLPAVSLKIGIWRTRRLNVGSSTLTGR